MAIARVPGARKIENRLLQLHSEGARVAAKYAASMFAYTYSSQTFFANRMSVKHN